MKALAAWLVAYWAVSLALLWALGWPSAFGGHREFLVSMLVIIVSWTIANKAERAVKRRG